MKRNRWGNRLLWVFFAMVGTLTGVTAWSLRPLPARVRTYYSNGKKVTETTSRTVAFLPLREWGFDTYGETDCGLRNSSSEATLHKLGFLVTEERRDFIEEGGPSAPIIRQAVAR